MEIVGWIAFFVVLTMVLLALFNNYLPKWFCDKMGWHLTPKEQWSDGCSQNGVCPRCNNKVMQDSQGNWF